MWVLLPWILGGIFIWIIASETGNQVGDSMSNAIGNGIKYLFASKEKKAEIREKNEEERKRKIEWEERQRYEKNPKNWLCNRLRLLGNTSEKYRMTWYKCYDEWEDYTTEFAPELVDFIRKAKEVCSEAWLSWVDYLVAIIVLKEGYYVYHIAGNDYTCGDFYTQDYLIRSFKCQHELKIEEFEKSGKIYY